MRAGLVFAAMAALSGVVCAAQPPKKELREWLNERGMAFPVDELNLSGMDLSTLDRGGIWELQHLKRLYLPRTNLEQLSPGICKLSELEELDLSDNGLNLLPYGVWGLENLKRLNLSGNRLGSLPGEIGNLTNLRVLDLSKNLGLRSFPGGMWRLPELEELYLSGMNLKRLPGAIGKLSGLRVLDLSENPGLKSLPAGIGMLSKLENLNLENADLELFPASMEDLWDSIVDLNLRGNNRLKRESKSESMMGWYKLVHIFEAKVQLPSLRVGPLDRKELDEMERSQREGRVYKLQELLRRTGPAVRELLCGALPHKGVNHKLEQGLLELYECCESVDDLQELQVMVPERETAQNNGKFYLAVIHWRMKLVKNGVKEALKQLVSAALQGKASQTVDDSKNWDEVFGSESNKGAESGLPGNPVGDGNADSGDSKLLELCNRIWNELASMDIQLKGLLKSLSEAGGRADTDTLEKTLPLLMVSKHVDVDFIKDFLGLPQVEELLGHGKLAGGVGKGLCRLIQHDKLGRLEVVLGALKDDGPWEREEFRRKFGEWLCTQARKKKSHLQHIFVLLDEKGLLEGEEAGDALTLEMGNVFESSCGNTKHLDKFLKMPKVRRRLDRRRMDGALKGGILRATRECDASDLQTLLELSYAEERLEEEELRELVGRGTADFTFEHGLAGFGEILTLLCDKGLLGKDERMGALRPGVREMIKLGQRHCLLNLLWKFPEVVKLLNEDLLCKELRRGLKEMFKGCNEREQEEFQRAILGAEKLVGMN